MAKRTAKESDGKVVRAEEIKTRRMKKQLRHILTVGGAWGMAAEALRSGARPKLRKLEKAALDRDIDAFR